MFKKGMLVILGCLFVLIGLVFLSPRPVAFAIYQLFKGGVAIAPEGYEHIEKQVVRKVNQRLPSSQSSSTYDVYFPSTKSSERLPTIIWVHGGAYVGGDKEDVKEYATLLANEGYVVVAMNYELAPHAIYPAPLLELANLVEKLEEINAPIDMTRLHFAGDSAGGQIVGQFILSQVDAEYREASKLPKVLEREQIASTLFFCTPFDIVSLSQKSGSFVMDFIAKRIGWAYFGVYQWEQLPEVTYGSLSSNWSPHFPPTFITDGNHMSFEEQAKHAVEQLNELGVEVTAQFYEQDELGHEYQFQMNHPAAVQTFERVTEFLQKKSQKNDF